MTNNNTLGDTMSKNRRVSDFTIADRIGMLICSVIWKLPWRVRISTFYFLDRLVLKKFEINLKKFLGEK